MKACQISSFKELMAHPFMFISSVNIYSTKLQETFRWVFMDFNFASTIILIFGGLFLIFLFQFYQVKYKWLNIPKYNFDKEKCGNNRNHPKAVKPSCKSRKNPPKIHGKGGNVSTT